MSRNVQRIRTAIITSKLIGPIVQWAWKHYVSAIAISAPNDCAEIPKIAEAGKCFYDAKGEYQLMHNGIKIRMGTYYNDLNKEIIEALQGHHEPQEELVFFKVLQVLPESAVMIEVGSYWAPLKIGASLHRANQIQGSHALSAGGWRGTAWFLRFEPALRRSQRKERSTCGDRGGGSIRILPAKAEGGTD